jgi:DNA helicase II / ATP-dependent DNA helicase PcrA
LLSGASSGSDRRLSQVGQLAVLARSFAGKEDLVEGDGLGGFIEYVRELAASKKGEGVLYVPPTDEAVRVMTVHKSKGLEFPVVYVPHLAKNHFPVRGGGPKVPLPPGFLHGDESGSREEEDRCLFYVALTRAEDELVLSRAEAYGAINSKTLPLIDRLVREKDGRVMIAEAPWESEPDTADRPIPSEAPIAYRSENRSAYRFWQLQSYDRCPLQAGYSLISGLPEKRSAYQDFRDAVYRVLGDMRLIALESGENPDPGWSGERLAEVWEEEGPGGHFYEPAYWRRAVQIVEAWRASRAPLKWSVREGLSLPLADGVRLEVTADAITWDPDGKIIVARHRFGRPRKSHKEGRNADRHALFIAAARETWPDTLVEVVLHYLPRDETVDATPSDGVITRRVGKLKGYVEKIDLGSFPPKPGRECKGCNWNLVCPSSA